MPQLRQFFGLALLLSLVCAELNAQVVQDSLIRDNRGKEFYLTFLPNFHNTPNASDDSVYIFISADRNTNVAIDYTSMVNQGQTNRFIDYSASFAVSANQVYTFALPYKQTFLSFPSEYFELPGYREGQNRLSDIMSVDEDVVPMAMHITSDEEVAVYGLNRAVTTSDAFMALPVDVLGENYFLLSYPSHDDTSSAATPSQFAVVATEDETEVEITPSAPTFRNNLATQTVVMNAGDVYLVQANVLEESARGLYNDLSGTNITSDKPIAVFSGHQRALVPFDGGALYRSRDHLVQQMTPLSTWGQQAIITPFPNSSDEHNLNSDLFRIVAALDGTNIDIGGTQTITLNSGEVYTGEVGTQAFRVKADGPIMVAEYRHSMQLVTDGNNRADLRQADPFMLLIPPVEQFLDEYLTINAQTLQFNNESNRMELVYNAQHMTLVTLKTNSNSVVIEPPPLAPLNWIDVPGTEYVYSIARVGDGVHEIAADTTVGVYIYGYGGADSYGYPGGVRFEKIFGPVIDADELCQRVDGFVADTSKFDQPIVSVEVPENRKVNVDVQYDPPVQPRDTVIFKAQLQNPYEDGEFYIRARDALRLKVEGLYELPGFTVHIDASIRDESTVEEIDSINVGRLTCYTAELNNYGKFPQRIDQLRFRQNSPEFTFDPDGPQFPLELQPGETLEIRFCFVSEDQARYLDTLEIVGNCIPRPLMAFDIQTGRDEFSPTITGGEDICLDPFTLRIDEEHAFASGIESIEIIESVNTDITLNDAELPDAASIDVRVRDRREDAIYHVIVRDSSGNVGDYIDTIPGFTLAVIDPADGRFDFGDLSLGNIACTEIEVRNFGEREMAFDLLQMLGNVNFSVPYSQYPIVLGPDESRRLTVCFHPTSSGELQDTLLFPFNCINVPVLLSGTSIPPRFTGTAHCSFVLSAALDDAETPGLSVVYPTYPNPTSGRTRIDMALHEAQTVTVRVVHLSGREVLRSQQALPAGQIGVELDVSGLAAGMYYYQISSKDINVVEMLAVGR